MLWSAGPAVRAAHTSRLIAILSASNVVGVELDCDGRVRKEHAVQITDSIGQSFTPFP